MDVKQNHRMATGVKVLQRQPALFQPDSFLKAPC
jgi:hypothetical protein